MSIEQPKTPGVYIQEENAFPNSVVEVKANVSAIGFHFKLAISGNSNSGEAAFQEASGISAMLDTEEIVEGGENRFKYKLPTVAKSNNLVLKRGVMSNNSSLFTWCRDTMLSDLVNPITTKTIVLTLFDEHAQPVMTWTFVDAWPVKWNLSDLKSQDNMLAIETLEFAYNYVKQVS